MTPAQLAAKNGHVEVVAAVLDTAHCRVEKGLTALHLAVEANLAGLVGQLLRCPAIDVNLRSADGLNALHQAASKGAVEERQCVMFYQGLLLLCMIL